jgi:hypothetical protein
VALAGLCSLTVLEAISGRHIRLPDPLYVFALLWELQKISTDYSGLFKPPRNRKMLAGMKPYQFQRNLALGRADGLLTSGHADKGDL